MPDERPRYRVVFHDKTEVDDYGVFHVNWKLYALHRKIDDGYRSYSDCCDKYPDREVKLLSADALVAQRVPPPRNDVEV